MKDHLRKTGIDVLGDIPWGTHFCQFYETKEDLLEILIPYFKTGLENNEFCLWITSPPVSVDDALQALRMSVPNFEPYLGKQSIEVRSYREWYLKAGEFNAKVITDGWLEKLRIARTKGFAGMRINGNETWLENDDWDNFMQYEEELNRKLNNLPIIVLCTYPLLKVGARAFLDVAQAHECVITNREGRWEMLEKPNIKIRKAQLEQMNSALDQKVLEKTSELAKVIESLQNEIIERKQIEEKLTKEKDLSNQILDSVPAMVVIVDENFRYLRWNKNVEIVSGYTREQLVSLHAIEDFYPDEASKQAAYKMIEEMRTSERASVEVTPVIKNGAKIALHLIGCRVNYEGSPSFLILGFDITELKTAEEKLRLASKRLSDHVVNTPLAVIEYDSNMAITLWSYRAEEIFGWKEAEVLGRNIYDLNINYEEDKKAIEKVIGELLSGQVERNFRINRNYTKAGNIINCEWYNSALKNQYGNIITILCLVHDVTERIKAEEAMQASYHQIRLLTEHLQNIREQERTHIAREIHDELGQQLTVLKMDVGWLRKKISDNNVVVKEKLEELSLLLDSTVQSVRRISSELRPSLLDDLGLAAAIEWQLKEFEKRSGIKTYFIETENEHPLSSPVKTNLYRILQEALTNIARHAQATEVKVELYEQESKLHLKITDNGQGFEQSSKNQKKTFGILGMKERAIMIGGTYEIQSVKGKGTEVLVTIPLQPKYKE